MEVGDYLGRIGGEGGMYNDEEAGERLLVGAGGGWKEEVGEEMAEEKKGKGGVGEESLVSRSETLLFFRQLLNFRIFNFLGSF